jgi:hypothetical protein
MKYLRTFESFDSSEDEMHPMHPMHAHEEDGHEGHEYYEEDEEEEGYDEYEDGHDEYYDEDEEEETHPEEVTLEKKKLPAGLRAYLDKKKKGGAAKTTAKGKAKPDFLDLDKDGDKKEPMKKAAKEAKAKRK